MGKLILQCWKNDIMLKILTIASILLIVGAFLVPPMAVIDSSVLTAVGELAGFGALWELNEAIDKRLNAKVKIKELELEINRSKDDDIEVSDETEDI